MLFAFSKDMLKRLLLIPEERYVVLEDEKAETALDILNSCVPLNPAGEPVEGGWEDPRAINVDVIYLDLKQELQLAGKSIINRETVSQIV